MEQSCASCPVCTLYLREGITLQAHLETHPKDKVIEALLKVTNAYPAQQTSQPARLPVPGQPYVATSTSIAAQTSNYGTSQTQVRAAVTYQHFVSSNASSVLPQYVQVVPPQNSPPVGPNQPVTYMPSPHPPPHPLPHPLTHPLTHPPPHPPPPYVPPIYGPLYNPYIPQPYPVVHPIYTNMPFSSDVNPHMSTSQVTSPVITPSTSQSAAAGMPDPVVKQVSTVATNTNNNDDNNNNSTSNNNNDDSNTNNTSSNNNNSNSTSNNNDNNNDNLNDNNNGDDANANVTASANDNDKNNDNDNDDDNNNNKDNTETETVPAGGISEELKIESSSNAGLQARLYSRLFPRFYPKFYPRFYPRLQPRLQPSLQQRSQKKRKSKKQSELKKKVMKSTSVESTSATSAAGSQRTINANVGTNAAANTSVITETKDFRVRSRSMSPKPHASTSASVITQLPVTPVTTLKSESSSESPSPGHSPCPTPNISHVPSEVVPPTAVEVEGVRAELEDPDSKPDLMEQNNPNNANVSKYSVSSERAVPSCSVITDRCGSVQLTGDTLLGKRNLYDSTSDSDLPKGSAFPQIPYHVGDSALVRDQQPEMSENVCDSFEKELFANEQDRSIDYDEEIPRKMFRPIEIEQENEVPFSFELGNQRGDEGQPVEEVVEEVVVVEPEVLELEVEHEPEIEEVEVEDDEPEIEEVELEEDEEDSLNRDDMFGRSDLFTPEGMPSGARFEEQEDESEYTDNTNSGGMEEDNATVGVKKVSSVIFLGSGSGSNLVTPFTGRASRVVEERELPEIKDITYGDLRPTNNETVPQDFEMAASLNLNNYMEVDGVKIFYNTGSGQCASSEPTMVFPSLKSEVPKVEDYKESENERETLPESVIHLVSGTNPNGDFSGETFQSSASENNTELRDLSPLSLNIRADESMPARGELSEQESLGPENSVWALYHSEIRMKSDHDLMSDSEFRATILDMDECDEAAKSGRSSFWRQNLPLLKDENLDENTSSDRSRHSTSRKSKIFTCSHCNEQFHSRRDKSRHILQNHFYALSLDEKIKAENDTSNETDSNSKENSPGSATEPQTEFVFDFSAVRKLEENEENGENGENEVAEKSESSACNPPDGSTSCDVTKVCPRCNLPFVGTKKLKVHLREVHGESKYKCGTCCEIFKNEKEFNAHLRIHPLKCNQCGKLFTRKPNLKLHVKRHLSVKPYTCSQCPKSFVTRQKLDEHVNGHRGHRPLKCTACDKTFSRHSNLIQHRNLHHFYGKKKVKDFVCRCGEVFHSARKLAWHKEVHDPKPKTCSFCCQKFIHKNSVTRHIRRTHMPNYLPSDKKDSDNVQCPVCGKIYLRSSLLVHMRVHNGEKPFVCNICSKSFTTKWNLELHNWTHQSRSSMPFKCSACRSAFYREVDYIAHMNSHRNFRPFTCNICGQKFIRKYNCLRHQEEHKREKRYVCAVPGCEKSFHRSYYLRDHMRIHTGARPHTCHICGKASSTKSNHNKHIRIHDTREPLNTEN